MRRLILVRASTRANKDRGKEDRSDFIEKPEINIFPDTLVWTSDYTYSYNDPISRNYFHHPSFDDYPVVGVSWKQAVAFSKWRTHILDNYLMIEKSHFMINFVFQLNQNGSMQLVEVMIYLLIHGVAHIHYK